MTEGQQYPCNQWSVTPGTSMGLDATKRKKIWLHTVALMFMDFFKKAESETEENYLIAAEVWAWASLAIVTLSGICVS